MVELSQGPRSFHPKSVSFTHSITEPPQVQGLAHGTSLPILFLINKAVIKTCLWKLLPTNTWPLATGLLTCSALPRDLVAEISTMSYHTQRVFPSGNEAMETPLRQVLVFPVFLLCAIWVVENQLIKVEVPRGWTPAEPETVCHVSIGSLEVTHRGWDLREGQPLLKTRQIETKAFWPTGENMSYVGCTGE